MRKTLVTLAIVAAAAMAPIANAHFNVNECGGDAECAALNPHILGGYGNQLPVYESYHHQSLCLTEYVGKCHDYNGDGVIGGDIDLGS